MLLLTGAVFAANGLSVKCVDESGKAVAGARVEIMAFGTGMKWKDAKADNSGTAKFNNLEDGAYRVVARPAAMAPVLLEPVFLKGNAQQTVTVQCKAGDPLKKFYWEDETLSNQSGQLFKQAVDMLGQQKYAEAEKFFQQSLEINPSHPDILFYYAVTAAQSKKWDLAKENFQKAVDMATALTPPPSKDPKTPTPENIYANTLNNARAMILMIPGLKVKVEGIEAVNAKDYKLGIAKLQEASKLIPGDPDTFYYLALSQGYDKQWQAAALSIEEAIKLRPQDEAYLSLRKTLAGNANLEKAKVIADEGDKLYNTKDYAGSLKKYEEALPMLSDAATQALLWVQIGRARTMLAQNDAAVEAYNRAVELDPKEPKHKQSLIQHYNTVAQRLINEKKYDEAFAEYAKSGQPVLKFGQDMAKKTETEDIAILAFQYVIKTEPENDMAYFELGNLYYFNKKDYVRARENFAKYVEIGKDEKSIGNARDIITVIDQKLKVKK